MRQLRARSQWAAEGDFFGDGYNKHGIATASTLNREQSHTMDSNAKTFARNEAFWNNYLKGRPRAPDAFFSRIIQYHQAHNGQFDTAHDVGAGNGPHAQQLRDRFRHVIVSDVVPENVKLAQERLGTDGFSYRAAPLEQADDIPRQCGLGLCGQRHALRQPGRRHARRRGAAEVRRHLRLRRIWSREVRGRGRAGRLGAHYAARRPRASAQGGPAGADGQDHGPKPGRVRRGAARPRMVPPRRAAGASEHGEGGLTRLLSPEDLERAAEPRHMGSDDVETWEHEEGWGFETNLDGIKEHFASFPFSAEDPAAFTELWWEMERLVGDGRPVRGYWPAKVILATLR